MIERRYLANVRTRVIAGGQRLRWHALRPLEAPLAVPRRIALDVVHPISSFAGGDVYARWIAFWNPLRAGVACPRACEHDFADRRSRFSPRTFVHSRESKFSRS